MGSQKTRNPKNVKVRKYRQPSTGSAAGHACRRWRGEALQGNRAGDVRWLALCLYGLIAHGRGHRARCRRNLRLLMYAVKPHPAGYERHHGKHFGQLLLSSQTKELTYSGY